MKLEKLKIGDIVTIDGIQEISKEQLFIIYEIFENIYYLATIKDNHFYYEYKFSRFQLKKYNDKISNDNPLNLLKAIYLGKIRISMNILEKIEKNEILLNEQKSWRDYKELNCINLKIT